MFSWLKSFILLDANEPLARFQIGLMKLTALIGLVGGGISPIFRQDKEALFVSAVCVIVLAALAAMALFRKRMNSGHQ